MARISAALPSVLTVRAYRRVWIGSLASNGGTWLQIVAAGYLVWDLTGSALAVGGLAVAARGPSVVLAPVAGALADRIDRRAVTLATFSLQSLAALALAAVAAADALSVVVIYALSIVLWSGFALGLPAMLALIPQLVPRRHFSQAVTVNAAGINVARLIGPAIGGAVLALAGPAWCFALNAATYWVLIVALARAPRMPPAARRRAPIAEGLRFAARDAGVRRLLLGMGLFTALAAVIQELAPVINGRLDGGEVTLGALLSAMGGGGVVGAVVYERLRGRGVPAGRLLPFATAVFGCGLMVIALSPWFGLTLSAMFFCGVFWIWQFSGTNTSLQLRAPGHYVGRMLGFYQLAVVGGIGVGSFVAGAIAARIGIGPTLAGGACLMIVAGAWGLARPVPEVDQPAPDSAAAPNP